MCKLTSYERAQFSHASATLSGSMSIMSAPLSSRASASTSVNEGGLCATALIFLGDSAVALTAAESSLTRGMSEGGVGGAF